MERKLTSDYPQELLDLFHEYQHGDIDRRTFLDRSVKFAVGGLTVAAIFESLHPTYAWAQQVPPDDKRIKVGYEVGAVAGRQRHDQGLSGAAGKEGKAAGRARHSRKPWTQSLYRGRCASPCARQFHRLCA